ncbi:MAG: glycoside hydrolase family 88 protein [Bacteroidetes bacterium]|nr:glycoside hydrolase family 88 protein [Bacteroidota bacterium]
MIDTSEFIPLGVFKKPIARMWEISGKKLHAIEERLLEDEDKALVYTRNGRYTSQGWTDWTRGFQVGSMLLQAEATDSGFFLEWGRIATMRRIQHHLTHFGVHDHGFTTTSTFGALLRLMDEHFIEYNEWERNCYVQALLTSGSVQAHRWTELGGGYGFIHSFNGPHSLFADTIRSLRALAIAYLLGGVLRGEQDKEYSLLERLVTHAQTTSEYIVFRGGGEKTDGYDVRGRVAHEAIFNVRTGTYRCPSTQQGYSPFSTWTRGLAWIILGCAEILEFLDMLPKRVTRPYRKVQAEIQMALWAAADYYIESTPTCGVPYWDTGAPGLKDLSNWSERDADPFNDKEPVDSSAAAIAAQGLLRLGKIMGKDGRRYTIAGRKIALTLLHEPYLSLDPAHEGLLLHSVYHWPRRWDYVPDGANIPHGESVMWGDYHLRELALYLQRLSPKRPYYSFANFYWNVPVGWDD